MWGILVRKMTQQIYWWTNAVPLNGDSIRSCLNVIGRTKHNVSLRGIPLIYFTFYKSNWGAFNLAAQKQLSESCAMRGERGRGWREKRDEESETQRQFGLIMLIFPLLPNKNTPALSDTPLEISQCFLSLSHPTEFLYWQI